jgi:hypothetical protein
MDKIFLIQNESFSDYNAFDEMISNNTNIPLDVVKTMRDGVQIYVSEKYFENFYNNVLKKYGSYDEVILKICDIDEELSDALYHNDGVYVVSINVVI